MNENVFSFSWSLVLECILTMSYLNKKVEEKLKGSFFWKREIYIETRWEEKQLTLLNSNKKNEVKIFIDTSQSECL